VEKRKIADKPSDARNATPLKTWSIDFDFENLIGAAIADVVVRKRSRKRKSGWNVGPKR
jgi:hypothetical protein